MTRMLDMTERMACYADQTAAARPPLADCMAWLDYDRHCRSKYGLEPWYCGYTELSEEDAAYWSAVASGTSPDYDPATGLRSGVTLRYQVRTLPRGLADEGEITNSYDDYDEAGRHADAMPSWLMATVEVAYERGAA